jgi:hypothetical protein
MSPSSLQSILLLKVNWTDWDALSVGKSMGKTTVMSFGGDNAMQHAVDNNDEIFMSFTIDEVCLAVLPMYWYCW